MPLPPGPPFRVSHVFFDVDGTLVDFRASLDAGLIVAAEVLSERTGRIVTPRALQETRDRIARSLRPAPGRLADLREQSFRQVLRERGVDDEGAVADVSRRFYEARDAALEPYEDVEPTLRTLRERGFVLVAATNGNAALMRTPLFALLQHAFSAEQAGVSKPHPRFFELALQHAGAEASCSVMVGDRLDNDVEPAVFAGMPGVLLDRHGQVDGVPVPASAVIRSLAELPGMLERAE
ncbi:MAG: HAD family hydrolase [Dehalococcoidia bacterium]|nr:HAD family hydrolase [Dehalococcoidia bacterium]